MFTLKLVFEGRVCLVGLTLMQSIPLSHKTTSISYGGKKQNNLFIPKMRLHEGIRLSTTTLSFSLLLLYAEWSTVLCKSGYVARWFHHPLLKRCECREHLLRKSICTPLVLCNTPPPLLPLNDTQHSNEGKKGNVKHNPWWTADAWLLVWGLY